MSKILLLGDCHGRFYNILYILNECMTHNIDISSVIQCGDFGFYEREFATLKKMNVNKFQIPVNVIDGNHEDHEWLSEQDHEAWKSSHNIFYKKRGTIEEIDGSIIAYVGGALNVDRAQHGSINKRTTNYLLDIEVNEFLEKAKSVPKIDLMVTHSCPHSIGVGMIGHPYFFESIEKFCHNKGHTTGRNEDCGDGSLTKMYRGLSALGKLPTNWVFGHYHAYKMAKVGITNFYCIGTSDSSDGKKVKNPFVYDTQKKEIEFFPDKYLLNFDGYHSTHLK